MNALVNALPSEYRQPMTTQVPIETSRGGSTRDTSFPGGSPQYPAAFAGSIATGNRAQPTAALNSGGRVTSGPAVSGVAEVGGGNAGCWLHDMHATSKAA